jgi:hypothetical protein
MGRRMLLAVEQKSLRHSVRVSGNSEGGDPWEGLSRLGRGGAPPPQGEGYSLRLPVPKGGGPSPLGGGVECWCYGQILPVNCINMKRKLAIEILILRDNCQIIKIAMMQSRARERVVAKITAAVSSISTGCNCKKWTATF